MKLPFGPWRPDAAGLGTPVCRIARNVLPAVAGFRPLLGPVPSSGALDGRCFGAANVLLESGANISFAGDATKLYKLGNDGLWDDATRLSGGAYATPTGEQWRFELFGSKLVATNYVDDVQVIDVDSGANFAALAGSPPKGRYLCTIRDFLQIGSVSGNERRVQWSAINDIEGWTPGTDSSDFQDFPSGGPVRGMIGGEVGYVWLADKVFRQTFVPGSAEIFQFDEVEGGRGLRAPGSLVRVGREAFYFGGDGFYKFDLGGGASIPIGVGKWAKWLLGDMRAGTDTLILSALNPRDRVIIWPYISRSNSGQVPDRMIIYDWALDEADYADVSVEAMTAWLSQGYTLDTINSFGTLDDLPYSLDSPFWKGGTPLLGLFGTDHKLAHLEGAPLEALFETSDGAAGPRELISGTRPHVDSASVYVAVAAREKDGDAVVYADEETVEDNGTVPAWVSGRLARARVRIPAGASWTLAKGIETIAGPGGSR